MIRKVFRILPLSQKVKKYLKSGYFFLVARFGIDDSPALNDLDRKLERYLPFCGGVFVEAGANDGISQSNTWYFEACKGWTGLLIEPVPWLAALARKFRKAPVINVALCSPGCDRVRIVENDLTSKVGEAGGLAVEAQTLSAVLDRYGIGRIDLFSLDVEGFELQVLGGLELERHKPRFILVETSQPDAVAACLGRQYCLRDKLSHHDYLFEAMDPVSLSVCPATLGVGRVG